MGKFLCAFLTLLATPVALFAAPGLLEFVANQGQWSDPFRYKVSGANGSIFLENNQITYVIGAADNIAKIDEVKFGKKESVMLNYHTYKMVFEGAYPTPAITEGLIEERYYNYYLGNDPTRWKTGIHPCREVNYREIYKNIGLRVSSEGENLKYDFIVRPGADPSVIRLRYDGVERAGVKNGNLQLPTSVGTVEELKPYAYQLVNGQEVKVFCKYKVYGNVVSYSFPDGYDKTKELIIDPTVVFATFTGSTADNWGFTATYDAAGNFYAGGQVSGNGYKVTPGAFQLAYVNGSTTTGNQFPSDISISKFNAAGTAVIYATYIGGKDNEQPHSLVVDAGGNLIIAGRTYSSDYPVTPGCFDPSYNDAGDMIITKLNAAGTALVGSTFVGGKAEDVANFTSLEFGFGNLKHNYGDDARSEVIVDQAGNIYVAACTKSDDFPTTSSALKTKLTTGDAQDGVVLKMNSTLTSMIYGTYLGGTLDDAAYVLALDKTESNFFVAGGTMSTDMPGTTGAYIAAAPSGINGFISKFLNSGSYPLLRTTYIGANSYDQCYGVQVDASNNVYAMGQTLGGGFPVTPGVYSNAGSSQFVIKLDNLLSTNLASTVYGSGNPNATNISPVAFLVDTCGNVYISGWGGDIYAPRPAPPNTGTTTGMPTNGSAGPPAQGTTDGADFYFIVFSRNMASLLYATFMGGTSSVPEHVDGGTSRFDKSGVVYQAICGACGGTLGSFPTTAGSYSVGKGTPSTNCNLVALKIRFDLGPVKAGFTVAPNGIVCLGQPFNFTNTSSNGITYLWDFGDGNFSSAATPPPHTYTNVGSYTVKLKVTNPTSCNSIDSMQAIVKVDTNSIKANFKGTVIDTCAPWTASFTNLSKLSSTPSTTTFKWDFGDGTTSTAQNPPNKNYPGGGSYYVRLTITDPNACNSPDSMGMFLNFRDDNVKAGFEVPPLVCLGDSFAPTNTSEKALSYLWNFGDNKTSTLARPFHKYDTVGFYRVTLTAYNPETCNKVDSMSRDIEVKPSPLADFTYTPVVPVTNEISRFTNRSQNAIRYNWNFGDGTGTEETNPEHFYKRTGTYLVCLVATNKEGCTDTVCKNVPADVLPLADIPNAFSPNGDGNNDILFVYGAAIEKINLKIYNRWGQVVFESNDIKKGWDGTYKGKPQEMDAYAYVLNVTFIDETTLFKKGNVTLLR